MGGENRETSETRASVEVTNERRKKDLPNFLLSVRLKYVKLRYHYLISHAKYLVTIPLLGIVSVHLSTLKVEDLWDQLKYNLVAVILCSALMAFLGILYLMTRPKKVYLVDFACYKPGPEFMCTNELFMEKSRQTQSFSDEDLAFQKKILERSGLGQKTYVAGQFLQVPANLCISEARKEAEMVIFGTIDQLLAKTRVKTKEIGILVVNCGLFCPTPCLSSMIVNHYDLPCNILSYNLSGMGCSAGLISIKLANQLLQVSHHF